MKRVFDIVISLAGLVILLPIMLIIVALVLTFLGKPVIFSQIRPGKNCKPFKIYKFRTMTNKTDASGRLLSNEQRITSLGLFLRSSSLDELPELINVLKGDMSIIGPRPLLMDYIPLYNNSQLKRHDVKPGITGWAQVNGRNSLTWEEKFKLDIWYIDNHRFMVDLKILWLTLIKVLIREGISHKGDVTMPRFKGNINK